MLKRENGQRITPLRASPPRAKDTGAGAARGRAQRHMVVGMFTVADGVPEAIRLGLSWPSRECSTSDWWRSTPTKRNMPCRRARASSWLGTEELLATLAAIAILVDPDEAPAVRGDIQLVSHALRRGGHSESRQGIGTTEIEGMGEPIIGDEQWTLTDPLLPPPNARRRFVRTASDTNCACAALPRG
ncbi:hypothetical protein [Burkholderia gladioli]|uniref:hypothetical protein n=1 Tax=Burkholderia gladioli TaxID=28095 RepID=UPI00163EA58F|nr:hypothetical protein [Burkholderia gladioli]